MKRLVRAFTPAAVLVPVLAGALVAIPSPGVASPGRIAGDPPLSHAQERAVLRAPHPYIRKACGGELFVSSHRWTTVGQRRVLIAQVGCEYGTSGSPQDTGVYTKHGYQRYLLDRGRPFHRGAFWVTTATLRSPRAGTAVIRYDGYAPKDAMCCPSRFYARTYTLGWSRAQAGELRRIPSSGD